jgi:hypothetical protein
MKIAYRKQSQNPDKHPLMNNDYFFDKYEIADDQEQAMIDAGYTVLSEQDFNSTMAALDLTAYNAAIAPTSTEIVNGIVERAKVFGDSIAKEFKTENVLMGITQAGKTVAVTKYMHWIEHHTLAGSLYAALEEIATKQAEGLPSDLSPFVTDERLTAFKNKIKVYLGIPI